METIVKEKNFNKTRWVCYLIQIDSAILFNVTSILFYFLMGLYGLSISGLGILVLVTFLVNVAVNLSLSKFVDKIGFRSLMLIGTLLAGVGFIVFSVSPFIFQNVFLGFIISTVIFGLGNGLFQLLLSPIINSLPTSEKSGNMTKLHSFYAWGTIFTVLFTTLMLYIIRSTLGDNFWYLIPLTLSMVSFICFGLFLFVPLVLPKMAAKEKKELKPTVFTGFFIIAALAILLGGATEIIISQWASTYIESVMKLDKVLGDILGVCLFALMLGLGRILYSKFSKKINLSKLMLLGASTAIVCYLIIALSPINALSLIAFGMTGLAVSLLWPGTLSLTSEKFSSAGTWLFALLTAAGSIGAAAGPYIFGLLGDNMPNIAGVKTLSKSLGITPFELGLRIAVLVCVIFPICAFFAVLYLHRRRDKKTLEPKLK